MVQSPEIGDVYELHVRAGYAYLQLADRQSLTFLVRVLEGVFQTPPGDLLGLVNMAESFTAMFPVSGYLASGELRKVGHFDVPAHAPKLLPRRIRGVVGPDTPRGWWIKEKLATSPDREWSALHPDIELRTLPIHEVISADYLRALIDNGYVPNDEGTYPILDQTRSPFSGSPAGPDGVRRTTHFLYFTDSRSAEHAAERWRRAQLEVSTPVTTDGRFAVTISHDGQPDTAMTDEMEITAMQFGGVYDGNEYGPL